MHPAAKFVAAAVVAFTMSVASRASAQEVQNNFQLGLLTSIFSYAWGTSEDDATGVEVDTTSLTWGIGRNILLEGGYALSDSFVVGGVLRLAGSRDTTEVDAPGGMESETESFSLLVGPKLDWMLSPRGPQAQMVPFVGAIVGFTSESTEIAGVDNSANGLALRLRGGLRWFAMSGVSFDPQVALGWDITSGEVDSGDGSTDIDGSLFSISVLLGVSGWI